MPTMKTVVASAPSTFAITGGADASKFSIDPNTGDLSLEGQIAGRGYVVQVTPTSAGGVAGTPQTLIFTVPASPVPKGGHATFYSGAGPTTALSSADHNARWKPGITSPLDQTELTRTGVPCEWARCGAAGFYLHDATIYQLAPTSGADYATVSSARAGASGLYRRLIGEDFITNLNYIDSNGNLQKRFMQGDGLGSELNTGDLYYDECEMYGMGNAGFDLKTWKSIKNCLAEECGESIKLWYSGSDISFTSINPFNHGGTANPAHVQLMTLRDGQVLTQNFHFSRLAIVNTINLAPLFTLSNGGHVNISVDEYVFNVLANTPMFAIEDGTTYTLKLGKNAPINTVRPTATFNDSTSTFVCTANGTWTGAGPITYTYQWLRGGKPITGATSATKAYGTADAGQAISCQVIATNSGGYSVAPSAAIYSA